MAQLNLPALSGGSAASGPMRKSLSTTPRGSGPRVKRQVEQIEESDVGPGPPGSGQNSGRERSRERHQKECDGFRRSLKSMRTELAATHSSSVIENAGTVSLGSLGLEEIERSRERAEQLQLQVTASQQQIRDLSIRENQHFLDMSQCRERFVAGFGAIQDLQGRSEALVKHNSDLVNFANKAEQQYHSDMGECQQQIALLCQRGQTLETEHNKLRDAANTWSDNAGQMMAQKDVCITTQANQLTTLGESNNQIGNELKAMATLMDQKERMNVQTISNSLEMERRHAALTARFNELDAFNQSNIKQIVDIM